MDLDNGTSNNTKQKKESRRNFLKGASAAAMAAGSTLAISQNTHATDYSASDKDAAHNHDTRAYTAKKIKIDAARQHFRETLKLGDQLDNNDERRYKNQNFYGSFTKTLPSNAFGEVDTSAFKALRRALRTGRNRHFQAIPLSPTANRRLENPQGALRFEISGIDSHATRINPSFTFRSKQGAAEMAEVYWQALTRDVPYIDYNTDSLIDDAVADLNNFSKTPGPTNHLGRLTTDRLFRGEQPGDLKGPYISQFLLRDVNYGPSLIEQRYEVPIAHRDFMLDTSNWLHIQRGGSPLETPQFDSTRRYIFNNRSLAEYVHRDALYQAYLYAALQILSLPGADKFDSGNPYFNGTTQNQTGFSSLGGPQVLDAVSRVANISLCGAWFQKWRVHRILRPEAYAARVNFTITGERSHYEVNNELLNASCVQQLLDINGNALCPQAYPEGSPTHPSYPAGHATVAGSCVTVLKAFFNEDYILEDTVQANGDGSALVPYNGDTLTLGGELNKLANNVSIGRDAAGVHYRQDGIQGLEAGEQQAICYLQDQSRTYNESDFGGFSFTRFNGDKVTIINGDVVTH